ncbi:hypothetical protein TNCV_4416101 [Trichonephila clavipes]|uniref:Uncharacterized protein n=1 Tax=Trichonephila clavipes TaxID=2585209 RepID=A0A8X6VEJ2_TRICX|nr:hypothetical protein TNCV_4416101 [Trichonephila clavipes]
MEDKDILEFVLSSKNIIHADPEDENEMNNAAPVPMASEMTSSPETRNPCLRNRYPTQTCTEMETRVGN